MKKKHTWTKEDLVKIFELLLERNIGITSHPVFRNLLDRNRNLFANQITREANSNIAYRTMNRDITEMTDDEIWSMLDHSEHNDLIEENAAAAMVKMAEKLNIIDEN